VVQTHNQVRLLCFESWERPHAPNPFALPCLDQDHAIPFQSHDGLGAVCLCLWDSHNPQVE